MTRSLFPFASLFVVVTLLLALVPAGALPAAAQVAQDGQSRFILSPDTTVLSKADATTRVSVASDGTQGNDESGWSFISADGRYVAFMSEASNLVLGDTNGYTDVFVHDRQTGQTELASVASDGTQANYGSMYPSISTDGRYVAFQSYASNLVLGDTNGYTDVFVHDRQTGQTELASVASDGTQGNFISESPSISTDGHIVGFHSGADNLVPGDTNGDYDVFIHDLETGQTTRVSVASDGTQGNDESDCPFISADGRTVAFFSWASNLVPDDTNGNLDVFVHDRQTGQTELASVASDGTQGNGNSFYPSLSADGRSVVFFSWSSNLVPSDTNGTWDVFVHDRQARQTTLVSVASDGTQGYERSMFCSISGDGRTVAFESFAGNLVPGDTNGYPDVFVHDRQTEQTIRVSVASDCTQANHASEYPSISADGRYVAFMSQASNLVLADTNEVWDVFVHDQGPGFLSLPYLHTERDIGLNRLTSYFDHEYPLYDLEPSSATGTLMRYDGSRGGYSYSGHDGYDFGHPITSPVLAAAGGTVTWSVTNAHYCWVTGTWVKACIAVIDHHNGYQTQYWHLLKIGGSNADPVCRTGSGEVNAEDPIGQVGLTGCTEGPHIHFVVRYDSSGAFGTDSKVDPYYPFSHGNTDPWTQTFQDKNGAWHTGTVSTWLWNFKPPAQIVVTPESGGQISTSWSLAVGIPPGAVLDEAFAGASIVSEPDSFGIEAQVVTTTVSVEPAVQITAVHTDGTPLPTFESPVTVTLAYPDTDVTYVDEATLALYQWDLTGENWTLLDTQIDPTTNIAQAHIFDPGILSLRGEPINPWPQIVAVSPISGSNTVDVQLTITGSGFLPNVWADLGPYMSLNVEVISATILSATVPAGLLTGVYALTVQNPDGQVAQLPNAYTIRSPVPTSHVYLPLVLRQVP